MNWKNTRLFDAEGGASGGDGTTTESAGENDVVFTPEQQAKVDALIAKSYAKGAAKAAKEAEDKAAREKQTEAERIAADRAALETEKAKFKVQAALTKEGYTVDEETDSALIGLFAAAPDALDGNLAALKKLIDFRVNQEVDKRLQGATQPTPTSGEKDKTVGDTINSVFRRTVANK